MAANPGDGKLYVERGTLPFVRHSSERRSSPAVSWQEIVPKPPGQAAKRFVLTTVPSNFHSRTEAIHTLVADLLNQFLRELGYGAVLSKLRAYAASVAA